MPSFLKLFHKKSEQSDSDKHPHKTTSNVSIDADAELASQIHLLTLAGHPTLESFGTNAQASNGDFIGGFTRPTPAHIARSPPFPVPASSPEHVRPGPLPRPPMAISEPQNGQKLSQTMQYAMSTPPQFSLPAPEPYHRAHSDSSAQPSPLFVPIPSRPPVTPRRPHLAQLQTPNAVPTKASSAPDSSLTVPPSLRPRAPSAPPSPNTSSTSISSSTSVSIQCSGTTKAGKRCARKVKVGSPLARVSPDADPDLVRYCHDHTKEVLSSSGFYTRRNHDWINWSDWIPPYLSSETQTVLRTEMEKAPSAADKPGYIYAYEIRDPSKPDWLIIKIGRAVNLVKRMDQWAKQCGSKEPILLFWWPGKVEQDDTSMLKGRVVAGEKGPLCHRLERMVHLEIADLAVNAQYLEPGFPNVQPGTSGTSSSSRAIMQSAKRHCDDCGAIHKEIFYFPRVKTGKYKEREWDLIVKPVIEKWGKFVANYQ